MKYFITLLVVIIQFGLQSQPPQLHIDQSTPFENILLALESGDHQLLASAFDRKTRRKTKGDHVWKQRIEEGKTYFFKRFGEYHKDDFKFEYAPKSKHLIIYFKEKWALEKKVKHEGRSYKLAN